MEGYVTTYSSYVFLKNGTTELEAQFDALNVLITTCPTNDFYEKFKTVPEMEKYMEQQQNNYDQLWLNTITPQGRAFLRTVLDNR